MTGVPPSGSGSRAAHEAAKASSPKASIPNAVADKLDEARALIERGWTQQAFARGRSGRGVSEYGKAAVCWCAYGALEVVRGQGTAAEALREAIGCSYIITWNDAPERTQAEVIDAFRRAAELARAGEL